MPGQRNENPSGARLAKVLGNDYKNLPTILDVYEKDLMDAEDLIKLKGKSLQTANAENPQWLFFYMQRRQELSTLVKFFDQECASVRGKLFRMYKKNHDLDLSDRAIDQYINNEETYLNVHVVLLEIKEMYEKFDAAVTAFTSRGYALNNITRLRIAEVQNENIC